SGLSLLTGCVGPAKPVAFIEDAAVRPAQLPEYVRGLQSIMEPLGLEASYYGHAASGLLHVRPVLDLHSAADLNKFRQVAEATSSNATAAAAALSAAASCVRRSWQLAKKSCPRAGARISSVARSSCA